MQRVAANGSGPPDREEEVADHAQVQRVAVDNALQSPARRLEPGMQAEMQARFDGADFSGVMVHDGSAAREAAAVVEARAFTTGQHIVDGGGMSRKDWAHELAHTLDQKQGPVPGVDNGAGLSISEQGDSGERHAVDTAERVMQGPAPVQRIASGGRSNDAEQHQHGHACGHDVQRVATGAVAVQRTRRVTPEEMEAARSRSAFARTAQLLRAQGKAADAARLENQLDVSLPVPLQGTVAFANDMTAQSRQGRRYKLTLDLSTMLYSVALRAGRKQYGAPEPANGKYNFVIPVRKPGKIMASEVGTGNEEGHSALAKATKPGDGHVYWAGTAVFTNGVLDKWTNDSGHYRPTGGDAGQLAGITGGFPADKYRNFDDPGAAD
ncbi:DUF4157 domain-containing protein [Streptomyces turgidiscabies]|uniref:eCIS core domain-containing protein n=1 Tax=Streptomyces TaxID=1883 RepID=UPI000304C16B|nr:MULTISPECIES: DUF4157 domain-containing protein [Streptomyces]MDX3492973.1 DUF4157 domain-containing protein [Streptomyces turgidiscabies]